MKQSNRGVQVLGLGITVLILMALARGLETWTSHDGESHLSQTSPTQTTGGHNESNQLTGREIPAAKSLKTVNGQEMHRIQERIAEIEGQTQRLGYPQSWAKKQLAQAERDQLLKLVIELERLESALLDLKLKALNP